MSNTNVVRSAVAGLLQTNQYIGRPLKLLPNSTLNQKLNIRPDIEQAATDIPFVQYVAIGNGGHSFVVGGNNRVKWKALHHQPKHTALYNQLPFVLRLPENDLNATERLRYRLRRMETHNGVSYVAYYLRVLDLSTTETNLELRHVADGVTTATPWVPTLEDLNPVPPALNTGEAVYTTGDYVASTAKVPFVMTTEEVQDFVDAVAIIEGEDGYAVISELATVSGIDKAVTGTFGGPTQSYTEAICAQITSYIATAWVMEYQTDGITLTVDVGNVEPLLTVSAVA